MVSRIPNDIFQFSTSAAFSSGLTSHGPQAGQLSGYGTHGLGLVSRPSDTSSPPSTSSSHNNTDSLVYLDSKAWHICAKTHRVTPAEASTRLPFVQVTKFEPEHSVRVPDGFCMGDLLEPIVKAGKGEAGGRNSFMPVRLTGRFSRVVLGGGSGNEESGKKGKGEGPVLRDLQGTVFGFASPSWTAGISVPGLNCAFISRADQPDGMVGGRVIDFEAGEGGVVVEWAVTGRYHLGFPGGREWESLDLKR